MIIQFHLFGNERRWSRRLLLEYLSQGPLEPQAFGFRGLGFTVYGFAAQGYGRLKEIHEESIQTRSAHIK